VSVPSSPTLASVQGQILDDLILTFSGTSTAMTFTGTDGANCTFNGAFNEEAVSNVYDVTLAVSGAACTAASYTGSGFESSSDLLDANSGATGVYLYGMMTSASTAFVFEVVPGGGDAAYRDHVRANKAGIRNVFGFKRVAR